MNEQNKLDFHSQPLVSQDLSRDELARNDLNPTDLKRKVMTVSELNRLANQVLTQSFPLFWVS